MKGSSFASFLVMVPLRRVGMCACMCKPMRNIIMQIMIHQSEYLHLHSCARAPFHGSSGPLSPTHTRAPTSPILPHPLAFSSLFFLSDRSVVRLWKIAGRGAKDLLLLSLSQEGSDIYI